MNDEWLSRPLITPHSSFITYAASRSVDSGSKRYVVLRSFFRTSDLLDELIEVLGVVHEVDLVGIDDQQRRFVVPVKVVRIRLAELLQILWRDRLLVRSSALLDALEKCIKIPLQVDDQLGLRHALQEQVVEAVVDHELGVV